jgi:hypothetical protein
LRYHKGHIVLSDEADVPLLLHVRNARAVLLDQLHDLMMLDFISITGRSLRWRVARLEKFELIARAEGHRFLGKPVYQITQKGLAFLESRGHYLFSLPSNADRIVHPSQVLHALELVKIRVALGKAGLLRSWKSDLEISSRNLVTVNPTAKDYDALAEIDVDGALRSVAIEYERTPKATARYRALREVLDKDVDTDVVLYLTPNDDILYLVAMELNASRRRIGFALVENFRQSLLETRTLTNSPGADVVPLRELLAASG